jgi:hypothetical protein
VTLSLHILRMVWISSAKYYTNMLRKTTNLTGLRLTNTSSDDVKDYTTATPYLSKILTGLQLDSLQRLVLVNWSVPLLLCCLEASRRLCAWSLSV